MRMLTDWRGMAAGLSVFLSVFAPPEAAAGAWRLGPSLGAPENLTVTGSYRARYETLDGLFRAGASGSDQILAQRLLLGAEYDFGGVFAGAELEDSRAWFDDGGTPLGTDDVNAVELLRAYVGYRLQGAFADGDRLEIAAGRITIDSGSRRFAARNRFRNTINGFTGVHALWTGAGGDKVQAFYTMPTDRRPKDAAALRDNAVRLDEENPHVRFWGALFEKPGLFGAATGEIYVYGLTESDRPEVATRDRRLYTPGFRLHRPSAPGQMDFEIETAFQLGHSRASTAASATRLDHHAHFHHAEVGYTADDGWNTRIALQYDYASGDKDPADGDNQRFDTLFGARRFEFGPTGIYGALARSNISSPGVRIEAKPTGRVDGFVGWRAAFLAASRDAWTTAGVQDASGASGSFVGNQVEVRLRYALVPGNVRLEGGGAVLVSGGFLDEAPNAAGNGDALYLYSQLSVSF